MRLHKNGYMRVETLTFIFVPELREMGFKFRDIAAMKAAMKDIFTSSRIAL